ncbi:MAG: hypothetical protein AAFR87_14095 [Bacteroidota bacterium]
MQITSNNWNKKFQLHKEGEAVFHLEYGKWNYHASASFQDQLIQMKPRKWYSSNHEILKDGEKVGWIKWKWNGRLEIHVHDEQNRLRSFELKAKNWNINQFIMRSLDLEKDLFSLRRTSKWYQSKHQYKVEKYSMNMPGVNLEELVLYALHASNIYHQANMGA